MYWYSVMSKTKEKLQADIKSAMRERSKDLLLVLRGLMAAFKQVEVDTREGLAEEQAVEIVQKEIKKRRDAVAAGVAAGRADFVSQNEGEIEI